MQIEETNRGFSVARFPDAIGSGCSIQDSSLADEAAVWFGVSHLADGARGERMHLTQGMARMVAAALMGVMRDPGMPSLVLQDRYDNRCIVDGKGTEGGAAVRIGVIVTREGDVAEPMHLTADMVSEVMPLLIAFVQNGTVSMPATLEAEAVLAPRERPEMDVKIPESMIARADVGESGVSAQDLVDALCEIIGTYDMHEIRDLVGYDRAEEVMRIREGVKRFWRNPDGTHAILR